ncbi:MAG: hypothetical protein ACK5Y2_07510 [Bdellovibrionales bacterium]
MKKLLVLIVLGFFAFIGGQWWGLRLQETRRVEADASRPEIEAPAEVPAPAPVPAAEPPKAPKKPKSAPVEKARSDGSVGS